MSKAEERALEAYPKETMDITGFVVDVGHPQYMRDLYIEGYHQAEKDNELTCDDIEIIINAFLDYKIESIKSGKTKKHTNEEYCVEILKRFKDYKERKEK